MSEASVQTVARPRKRQFPRGYAYPINYSVYAPLAEELGITGVTLTNLNAYWQFRFKLMNACDVPNKCFQGIGLEGSTSMAVVFADNYTRERMKVDEELVQRVKKFLKTEEDPKWYFLSD
ncbi:hypothetical protein BKA93DRAFT_462889 [Sparassis latifolia]|uniref:Uncharacterized protein n=1 Tax=Sparassis crispa TaxID=139825 RepID=A0A401H464_9APHY|nr:hypothetical protein SCP_1501460 [Sparassis crispa]GBE89140.1 hypothetical protein SCP_1501460 [Sparassis crispa]